jgi:hypothetical protein
MAHTIRRRLRILLAALLLWTTWSCGDPPSGPGNTGLLLAEGSYSVFLGGFDFSTDPRIQVCSPIGVPPGGKNIQTTVDLRHESSEWVARSTTGAGDLVIRLEAAGSSRGSTVPVQGFLTGTALWADARLPAHDVRVRFDGGAMASGDLTPAASFVNGQITGTIVFSDSSGAASTCPMVIWTMQPVR